MITSRRTVGIMALLVGVFCWGVAPVMLRGLASTVNAWTANGFRYPLAAVLYWPFLIRAYHQGVLDSQLVRRCIPPAALAFLGQIFWSLSFYELPASQISFMVRLSTVWTVMGSMILFSDERPLIRRPGFYAGLTAIVIGFLGVALARPLDLSQSSAHGIVLIVLAGLFFGGYMLSVRLCIPRIDPILAFGTVAQFVSIGMIICLFAFGQPMIFPELSATAWGLLIGSSVLGIAMGHIMVYASIQRLGASIATSCQSVAPFVTASVAHLWLHESLTTTQWAGGFVMVAGAVTLLSLKHQVAELPQDQALSKA